MTKRKQPSPRLAKLAPKTLLHPRASKANRALAGTALAQTGTTNRSKAARA